MSPPTSSPPSVPKAAGRVPNDRGPGAELGRRFAAHAADPEAAEYLDSVLARIRKRMVIHVIVASDPIQGGCEALREDHKGIGQELWRGPHGGAAVSHVVIQQLLLDPQQGSP
jgi:hypothetical protein